MKRLLTLMLLVAIAGPAWATEPAWSELVRASLDYLEKRQARLDTEFGVSRHERWDVDARSATLTFSSQGAAQVVARFQVVGSYSELSHTWLWSWGNDSFQPTLTTAATSVRSFGERHGFPKLVERKWEGSASDAWQMAAVTNYVLKAQGVYRPPVSSGALFLVLLDVQSVGATPATGAAHLLPTAAALPR